ncbi:MAG: archaemetzincin [Verrucomicrobiota bacterium]
MSGVSRFYLGGVLFLAVGVGIYAQIRPLKPFTPPDEAKRVAAVGKTIYLTGRLKAAFDPRSSDFSPIPSPGPNDWLANHHEPGQTYEQYSLGRRNRPDATRKVLYILPLGDFEPNADESLLEPLREYSEIYVGMPTKLLEIDDDVDRLGITTRINPGTQKRQLLTLDILALLRKRLPQDAFCLLAITTEDLYPDPSWNFVFGQASLQNRVGAFSFARYDPAFFGQEIDEGVEELVLRRSCDVLVHETLHMFGIRHCIYFHCIMNGSNHMAESDAAPMHLCPVCLRKLQYTVGFDPARRYNKLAEFYNERGFKEEEAWVKKRSAIISRR